MTRIPIAALYIKLNSIKFMLFNLFNAARGMELSASSFGHGAIWCQGTQYPPERGRMSGLANSPDINFKIAISCFTQKHLIFN